jgi:predicted MPP superfamily phosphohydrolase
VIVKNRKDGRSAVLNFKSTVIQLHLGLEKPVRILQLSDVHLSFADDIDGEDMKVHAAKRRQTFFLEAECPERDPVGYLENAMDYAKHFDCTVITGDVLDFTSHANREIARKLLADRDYMFCAGNHEFCPKVGVPDSFEEKERIFEEIQSIFRGNMVFESRIVGGLNVIVMDNSYFVWTPDQLERLKAEVARGLPCILFCHTPLTDHHMRHEPSHPNLIPDEREIEFTRTVSEYILHEPAIKAIFAGHQHRNSGTVEDLGEKKQYIPGALFKGFVGEILVD